VHSAWLESLVGPITVVTDGVVLHRVRWGKEPADAQGPVSEEAETGGGPAVAAAAELAQYFAGRRTGFDLSPDWERIDETAAQVLRTLVRVAPYGKTVSYGELTTAAGLPITESRAVGTYLNGNPWPIVVPCHRVVMTDGSLGGFGSGRWRKEALLRLEGVLPEPLFG
jgi:methylated-DNA-[protein]-cysteine S-methyltransferase